jgi:hypothetical protein
MRKTLISACMATALAATACGGSSARSVSSHGTTVTVPSANSVRAQVRSAAAKILPAGASVGVHMDGATVVVTTALGSDSTSKELATQACSAASSAVADAQSFRIESSSGSTLATC